MQGSDSTTHCDSNNTSCSRRLQATDVAGITVGDEGKNYDVISNGSRTTAGGEVEKDGVAPDDMARRKLPGILEIKKALPKHCFESRVSTSTYYMAKDFSMYIAVFVLCELAWPTLPTYLQYAVTPVYWLFQGTVLTAIFVVGHDAGHGSFSQHEWFNDICGNVCHGFILCPYYMWKLSHRNHHKNTGNIDKDDVYYPVRERDDNGGKVLPGFGLGVGWFGYLIKGYNPRKVHHYNPYDQMFTKHVTDCFISMFALAAQVSLLYNIYQSYGMLFLVYHYFVPLYIFGSYIVVITFLHHTESGIPWYTSDTWDNVRGQITSIDRDYGWCHYLLHSITTHQIHHLFPKVPHYHLEEATVVFRKVFPDLVNIRTEPILYAFCRNFSIYAKQCIIPNDTKVHVYK